MDELTVIMDGLQDKMGEGINVILGVGNDLLLGDRVEKLLMVGWNFKA